MLDDCQSVIVCISVRASGLGNSESQHTILLCICWAPVGRHNGDIANRLSMAVGSCAYITVWVCGYKPAEQVMSLICSLSNSSFFYCDKLLSYLKITDDDLTSFSFSEECVIPALSYISQAW